MRHLKSILLAALIVVPVAHISTAEAYNASRTHRWLTLQAVELLVASYPGEYDEVLEHIDQVVEGAFHEDDLYADGEDLLNPLLSPLYGDFSGFPPTILVSGTRDMLLSDTARAHRKLLAAGVEADLHVLEGMSHAEYMIQPQSPEGRMVYMSVGEFLKEHMD